MQGRGLRSRSGAARIRTPTTVADQPSGARRGAALTGSRPCRGDWTRRHGSASCGSREAPTDEEPRGKVARNTIIKPYKTRLYIKNAGKMALFRKNTYGHGSNAGGSV